MATDGKKKAKRTKSKRNRAPIRELVLDYSLVEKEEIVPKLACARWEWLDGLRRCCKRHGLVYIHARTYVKVIPEMLNYAKRFERMVDDNFKEYSTKCIRGLNGISILIDILLDATRHNATVVMGDGSTHKPFTYRTDKEYVIRIGDDICPITDPDIIRVINNITVVSWNQ